MSHLTDKEFEIIMSKYYKLLINIANKYLRSQYESEDVVQEVFIKFYITQKHFESEEHIKNWLIRLTINNSLDKLRQKAKIVNDDEYINNLPDPQGFEEKNEEIYDCVLSLKDSYKNIIILYYYEKYDLKKIATILKISETNAQSRLDRARKRLKHIILERRNSNE